MFEHHQEYRTIIVTGPHRSGTTIATEMIAHDTGKRCFREEAFANRDIVEAEAIVRDHGGVIQGPYLLPWVPMLAEYPRTLIVYMRRSADEIEASNRRLRQRGVSRPFFGKDQADRLWMQIRRHVEFRELYYDQLHNHPLWSTERAGWAHRQTRPGQRMGR